VVLTTEDSPAKNTRSKCPIRPKKSRRILDLQNYNYVLYLRWNLEVFVPCMCGGT
jgi:hypothetical protein